METREIELTKEQLFEVNKKTACYGVSAHIPPMMGKYLFLSHERYRLPEPGVGLITFEGVGSNDICICLHNRPIIGITGRDELKKGSPVYEFVIGGWSNTSTAIRKYGHKMATVSVDQNPAAGIRNDQVCSYWIILRDSTLILGYGDSPAHHNEILRWKDEKFVKVEYVGLGSWSAPIQVRSLLIEYPPPLRFIPVGSSTTNGERLLNELLLADTCFIVGAQKSKIMTHKCIIDTACSGIEFVKSENKDYDMYVTLPEVDPQIFNLFLRIIYTGCYLEQVDNNAMEQCVAIAHKYKAVGIIEFLTKHSLSHRPRTSSRLSSSGSSSTALLQEQPKKPETDIRYYGRELLDSELNADVWFVSEKGERIGAHKAVLCLCSDVFYAMFCNLMKESETQEIPLKDVSVKDLKCFLKYCYMGSWEISGSHVLGVLMLADRYQVLSLQGICINWIGQNIELDTCCALFHVSTAYVWPYIKTECARMIESNYIKIIRTSDLGSFSANELLDFVISDNLFVLNEKTVYDSIIEWGNQQKQKFAALNADLHKENAESLALVKVRGNEDPPVPLAANDGVLDEIYKKIDDTVELILTYVRYPLMRKTVLRNLMQNDPRFQRSETLKFLVEEALINRQRCDYNELYINRDCLIDDEEEKNYRFRKRKAHNAKELLFVDYGDTNGAFYYVSTNYGTVSVPRNPHLAHLVEVKISCPLSRYSRPEVVVSKAFKSANYFSGSPPWISMSFEENCSLLCNFYTIRQDGSGSCIRTWTLQGSRDGVTWTRLRKHVNDQHLTASGQYYGWPLYGKAAQTAYRHFRIVMHGPASDNSNFLCISNVELYGFFVRDYGVNTDEEEGGGSLLMME